MGHLRASLSIAFLILSLSHSFSESCDAYKFVKTEGMELASHVIKTVTKGLEDLCWKECVWLPKCFSLNVRMLYGMSYECDLNNSTKLAAGGLVDRAGSVYHEMAENKTWNEAEAHCKSIGGNLVSINSAYKDGFVYEVVAKELQDTENRAPGNFYWALDGHDKDIRLHVEGHQNKASYQNCVGETCLSLKQDNSAADLPAVPFNPEGFTIAFKTIINTLDSQDVGTIYSDIPSSGNPGFYLRHVTATKQHIQFEIFSSTRSTFLSMRTVQDSVPPFEWLNIILTWNRTTNRANVVVNDEYVKMALLVKPYANAEIQNTLSKTYRLGYLANINGDNTFNGLIKQLMVFNRSLDIEEIKAVMEWSAYGPWIGLSDLTDDNTFGWSDGSTIGQYIPLPIYEPNVEATITSCVAMGTNGKWINKMCNEKRPFICQKP
ncbi:hypothetical protein QZH41_010689 [Actinostola sp. cb2023]|nr:hypothetical protein QZH41_010689 [Actinostola sp. cb2023]